MAFVEPFHLSNPELELLVCGCTHWQKPEIFGQLVETGSGVVGTQVVHQCREHDRRPSFARSTRNPRPASTSTSHSLSARPYPGIPSPPSQADPYAETYSDGAGPTIARSVANECEVRTTFCAHLARPVSRVGSQPGEHMASTQTHAEILSEAILALPRGQVGPACVVERRSPSIDSPPGERVSSGSRPATMARLSTQSLARLAAQVERSKRRACAALAIAAPLRGCPPYIPLGADGEPPPMFGSPTAPWNESGA